MADTASLDRLFSPKNIAIVGASTDPEKINGRPQHFLSEHGYEGNVYPVNPNYNEIDGHTCYETVENVPGEIDIALILVPANVVPTVLRECGRKGVSFALISSSGFSEAGREGQNLEKKIQNIGEEYNIRIVGPNCQGILNLSQRVTLSFSSMLRRDSLLGGSLGFVTQSGAFGGAIFQMTQDMGIGTKYWVSTGNEADIDAVEVIDHMVQDPEIGVIIAYIESIKSGEKFIQTAKQSTDNGTPILLLKVGQSERGSLAAASHTGKMAGDYKIYEGIFEETGVVALHSIEQFKNAVMTFHSIPDSLRPTKNGSLGVITASGGAGVLIADACEREGVGLADLRDQTRQKIETIIPTYGSTINPVDVTGNVISSPDMFKNSISILLEDPGVEAVILQFGNSGDSMGERYRQHIQEMVDDYNKPVFVVFTGGRPPEETLNEYVNANIPTFEDPVQAVKSFSLLVKFESARQRNHISSKRAEMATPTGRRRLPKIERWDHLQSIAEEFNIPVARGFNGSSPAEAIEIAERMGYPVVLKGIARGLDHKTEAGAVITDIYDSESVRDGYYEIMESMEDYDDSLDVSGILVQEQFDSGLETIVGVLSDTDFGPVMMFGAGGIFAEALNDVSYRSLPMSRRKARDLVESTNAGRILSGFRGREYDLDSLIDLLVATGSLYETFSGIKELEMNPVAVGPDGVKVLDFLMISE